MLHWRGFCSSCRLLHWMDSWTCLNRSFVLSFFLLLLQGRLSRRRSYVKLCEVRSGSRCCVARGFFLVLCGDGSLCVLEATARSTRCVCSSLFCVCFRDCSCCAARQRSTRLANAQGKVRTVFLLCVIVVNTNILSAIHVLVMLTDVFPLARTSYHCPHMNECMGLPEELITN